MHLTRTEQVVNGVRKILAQVSDNLSSRSAKLAATWHKRLKRYEPCELHLKHLFGLHLAQRLSEVSSTNPRAYREDSERQGRELAARGVPAECVAAAVALYFKSCLLYLRPDESSAEKWTRALARWTSIYQHFLLSGYSQFVNSQKALLEDKVHAAEKRVQDFSAKLGDAYEIERRRLAQDLHDEIGHDLIVLKLYTQLLNLDLKKGQISQLRRKLKESLSLINHALKGVRHLTFHLGPAVWSEQGFLPAVRLYSRQFSRRTGLRVRFDARRLKTNLPPRYETPLYKVIQGALSNAAAHSAARHVWITLWSSEGFIKMKVEDDGRGFSIARKLSAPRHSFGLRTMRDRIELLGGSIDFKSWPRRRGSVRHGTSIECRLPLREKDTA